MAKRYLAAMLDKGQSRPYLMTTHNPYEVRNSQYPFAVVHDDVYDTIRAIVPFGFQLTDEIKSACRRLLNDNWHNAIPDPNPGRMSDMRMVVYLHGMQKPSISYSKQLLSDAKAIGKMCKQHKLTEYISLEDAPPIESEEDIKLELGKNDTYLSVSQLGTVKSFATL
jgi:hypothetical protein